MTEKDLFRIMGDIDDRFVEEAAVDMQEKEPSAQPENIFTKQDTGRTGRTPRRRSGGRKVYWYGFASGVAAMLVLTVGLSVARLQINSSKNAEKADIPQQETQRPDQDTAGKEQNTWQQLENDKQAEAVEEPVFEEQEPGQKEEAQEVLIPQAQYSVAQSPEPIADAGEEEMLLSPQASQPEMDEMEASAEDKGKERDKPVLIGDLELHEEAASDANFSQGEMTFGMNVVLFKNQDPAPENGYILPDSLEKVLTEEDIENLTVDGIEYAKNEIWARYGRSFQSEELREYFLAQDWYKPVYEADGTDDERILSLMTEAAKKNLDFLAEKAEETD